MLAMRLTGLNMLLGACALAFTAIAVVVEPRTPSDKDAMISVVAGQLKAPAADREAEAYSYSSPCCGTSFRPWVLS